MATRGLTKRGATCPISAEFCKVARDVKVDGSFSWLRKTFATVAARSGFPHAVNHVMGHVASGAEAMPAVYRQRQWDDELRGVAGVVRDWLNKGRPSA